MALPKVFIIILNYNGLSHLHYSMSSILSTNYDNFVPIVVDNASVDSSIDYLQKEFPKVGILKLGRNLGWAGGNNAGINYAMQNGADYIVLANNDILIHPDWIGNAVQTAEQDPLIGLVGFRPLSYHADRQILESCIEKPEQLTSEPTNNVTGWAMFLKASVFNKIGLIDKRYYAFVEETDFEYRMKIAGYKFVRVNTPLCHFSGGTFSRYPYKAAYLMMRNELRFHLKYLKFTMIIKLTEQIYHSMRKGPVNDGYLYSNRFTPGPRWKSVLLFGTAIIWNFVNLPITIISGLYDKSRAKKALATNASGQII